MGMPSLPTSPPSVKDYPWSGLFAGIVLGILVGVISFVQQLQLFILIVRALEASHIPDSAGGAVFHGLIIFYGIANIILAYRTRQTFIFGFLLAIPFTPYLIMAFMINFVGE
jgi:hypothetical protein